MRREVYAERSLGESPLLWALILRTVMSLTAYEESCGHYRYGETEDICINISPSSSITDAKNTNKNVGTPSVVFESSSWDATNSAVSVYPNPAQDIVKLSDPSLIQKVEIFNAVGHHMKQVEQLGGQIDVSALTPGVYMFRLTDPEGLHIVERIVKQ